MINFENLRGQWEKTFRVEHGYTQVNTRPLDCHVGYDEKFRRTLLIIGNVKTKIPPSSQSVEIKQWRRRDGKFSLTLSLLSEDESAVFFEMCRDLLTVTENSSDESDALKKFWQRYEHWQKLFTAAKNDLLTPEQQRGLIGELLFLRKQILDERRPLTEAVGGWFGALKEHQDFFYGESWYEIKTVMEQAEKIRISSLEQLSLERRGELVVYRLGNTAGDFSSFDLKCFTLNSLVKNLSELLSENLSAAQNFEALLFTAGYVRREEYDEKIYRLVEILRFGVDETFPRLLKSKLSPAFVEATYSLKLSELKGWLL